MTSPPRPSRTDQPAASSTQQEAQALSFQRLIIARLIGKACLGVGFITVIIGVTNPSPVAVRTGLALLLLGVIASFVSLVQDFRHRRLIRQSTADPARPTTGRPPDPS